MNGALESANPGEGLDRSSRASELWLDELGKLTSLVLHDLRNGLQAVGINIEVIRSRSQRTDNSLLASELGGYASNAARQFDEVSRRVEALASLCKNPRGQADIVSVLESLAATLKSGQRDPLHFRKPGVDLQVGVGVIPARLVLTHVVLSAVRAGAIIECEVGSVAPVAVRFRFSPGGGEKPSEEVARAVRALHIHIDSGSDEVVVTFPTTLRSDTVFV